MKNGISNLFSKLGLAGIALVTGAVITFALTKQGLGCQTSDSNKISEKDRASLAYPILKRRGPLTKEELDRGAAPVATRHRSLSPLQANEKNTGSKIDF